MSEKRKQEGLSKYFRGVKAELRNVSWPSKEELVKYSGLVILMSFLTAVTIFIFDFIVTKLFGLIIG